jgi:hypothetical protein
MLLQSSVLCCSVIARHIIDTRFEPSFLIELAASYDMFFAPAAQPCRASWLHTTPAGLCSSANSPWTRASHTPYLFAQLEHL